MLEKEAAKTSRVIISSAYNKHLNKAFKGDKTFWDDLFTELIVKDIDGYLIINPNNLYSKEDPKADKARLIKIISDLKNKAKKDLDKEKYIPLFAALTSERTFDTMDLGNY